jgi:hypothetical protein
MNWLVQEKMFIYFCNKFRPVNRMYYIKFGLNSSLLTQFWLLHKVCGTLDHCFIMTHSIHKQGDILQIYFCVIFCQTRQHIQAHGTSGALCPFFGHEKNKDSRAVGFISLAIVCYGYFAETGCCCSSSSSK